MQQGMVVTNRRPRRRSAPIAVAPLAGGLYVGLVYEQPTTPCICSTVYYSVISACAACQDGNT